MLNAGIDSVTVTQFRDHPLSIFDTTKSMRRSRLWCEGIRFRCFFNHRQYPIFVPIRSLQSFSHPPYIKRNWLHAELHSQKRDILRSQRFGTYQIERWKEIYRNRQPNLRVSAFTGNPEQTVFPCANPSDSWLYTIGKFEDQIVARREYDSLKSVLFKGAPPSSDSGHTSFLLRASRKYAELRILRSDSVTFWRTA